MICNVVCWNVVCIHNNILDVFSAGILIYSVTHNICHKKCTMGKTCPTQVCYLFVSSGSQLD